MNHKRWFTTSVAAVAVSLALTANTAMADRYYAVGKTRAANPQYDYAKVLDAEPIVRYVTVETPVRECWNETREYAVENRPSTAGGTLVGAIIGGVVGHQFGSGRGNDAATVAGTLVGAAVGNNVSRRAALARGEYGTSVYSRPVERCETRYRTHQEERIDGYHVTYRYHGQKYATRLPYDPGNRIRVRVDVRPTIR